MKILLIGASSYVGAKLFYDLNKKYEVIGTYHGNKFSDQFIQLDVTNSKEVEKIVNKYKPNVIIHTAANARSQWCEDNPELAISLNQESTKNIVNAANGIDAKVILISSFAAINPNNVYGKTKQQSEDYVKFTKAGFVIIRPSLIIGLSPNTINDRPFNRILKNLDEGTEAIYDTSWKFQPSYLGHISEIISLVIDKEIINEIIPVAVRELKSRYDIANDILSAFSIKVTPIDKNDVTPTTTDKLEKLKSLNLPQYSYHEVIRKIIDEIKQRKSYPE